MNLSAAYLKKREEWKQEGMEKGMEKGREDIIIRLLRNGMAVQTIAEMVGIPTESIEKLRDQI